MTLHSKEKGPAKGRGQRTLLVACPEAPLLSGFYTELEGQAELFGRPVYGNREARLYADQAGGWCVAKSTREADEGRPLFATGEESGGHHPGPLCTWYYRSGPRWLPSNMTCVACGSEPDLPTKAPRPRRSRPAKDAPPCPGKGHSAGRGCGGSAADPRLPVGRAAAPKPQRRAQSAPRRSSIPASEQSRRASASEQSRRASASEPPRRASVSEQPRRASALGGVSDPPPPPPAPPRYTPPPGSMYRAAPLSRTLSASLLARPTEEVHPTAALDRVLERPPATARVRQTLPLLQELPQQQQQNQQQQQEQPLPELPQQEEAAEQTPLQPGLEPPLQQPHSLQLQPPLPPAAAQAPDRPCGDPAPNGYAADAETLATPTPQSEERHSEQLAARLKARRQSAPAHPRRTPGRREGQSPRRGGGDGAAGSHTRPPGRRAASAPQRRRRPPPAPGRPEGAAARSPIADRLPPLPSPSPSPRGMLSPPALGSPPQHCPSGASPPQSMSGSPRSPFRGAPKHPPAHFRTLYAALLLSKLRKAERREDVTQPQLSGSLTGVAQAAVEERAGEEDGAEHQNARAAQKADAAVVDSGGTDAAPPAAVATVPEPHDNISVCNSVELAPAETCASFETAAPAGGSPLLEDVQSSDREWRLAVDAYCEGGLGELAAQWVTRVQRAADPRRRAAFLGAVGRGSVHTVFHGVTSEPTDRRVASIASRGLDPKRCKSALFGLGAYVATEGAKALMYATWGKWDRRQGKCEERHQLPLRILLGLIAPGSFQVGVKGTEHAHVTADSLQYPTQYCVPPAMSEHLLITHVLTVDLPGPDAARPAWGCSCPGSPLGSPRTAPGSPSPLFRSSPVASPW
eukprot:TRINITY_DN1832_c1_g2_i3.p1 TRINITY_DN1832_c1_g2~~TRINITY_DN1832_c1_g2_i3.p1  ORF type:complete len:859 (+),score=127.64 TRINITY_DN1832_c1_g2_i3:58-2634(+)